jgi:NAD(P)-dependent dehydrogenase (short-subunit alcohol dehydrogenase family)
MELEGSSALVTGAASGLGAATARALAAEGVHVTVFDLNEDGARAVADEFGGSYVAGDVTNPGTGWIGRVIDRQGNPHELGPFEFIQRLNVIGTFNVMTRAAAAISKTEPLEDQERGVIVNTSSVAAFDGQIGQLAYSASKGAVVGMTLPAARDLAVVGIRVVAIAPGLFDTPLLGMLPEEQRRALGESVLFPKRLGDPARYGQLVVHIARNSYLNAEVIRLDGGIRMPPK